MQTPSHVLFCCRSRASASQRRRRQRTRCRTATAMITCRVLTRSVANSIRTCALAAYVGRHLYTRTARWSVSRSVGRQFGNAGRSVGSEVRPEDTHNALRRSCCLSNPRVCANEATPTSGEGPLAELSTTHECFVKPDAGQASASLLSLCTDEPEHSLGLALTRARANAGKEIEGAHILESPDRCSRSPLFSMPPRGAVDSALALNDAVIHHGHGKVSCLVACFCQLMHLERRSVRSENPSARLGVFVHTRWTVRSRGAGISCRPDELTRTTHRVAITARHGGHTHQHEHT